jgi:hypothetical protein
VQTELIFSLEITFKIEISENLCTTVKTVDRLISEIYPDIRLLNDKPVAWLRERALLTPKNYTAAELNEYSFEVLKLKKWCTSQLIW